MQNPSSSNFESSTFTNPKIEKDFTVTNDEWEREIPTASSLPLSATQHSLNDSMELIEEDNWEHEDFSNSMEILRFSVENLNKLDWEYTDWQRPDRLYTQAKKRAEMKKLSKSSGSISKKLKSITEYFRTGFRDRSSKKAVKRDWCGNEILPEDDWSCCLTTTKYNEEDRPSKASRL